MELNSHIDCIALTERFTEANAPGLIRDHDVVIDCCDNIETRYIINDECIRQGKVFVSGATQRLSGQVVIVLFLKHRSQYMATIKVLVFDVFILLNL